MSILIFLGVLFVLVLVHELGHYAVAKWTGMRVDEFGIGFPPKLFGIKRGETEYTFNLLPLGGFVKIFGEDGVADPSARPASDFSEQRDRKSKAGVQPRYEEDGVGTSSFPVSSETRSFVSKSKWAQSAVLLAGISMNILFAWLLVAIAFSFGVETSVTEAEATAEARLTITGVLPGSPAGAAGIAPGSVVQSMSAGTEQLSSLTPSAFSAFVETHKSEPLTLAYSKAGELFVAQISPTTNIITEAPEKFAIGVSLSQIDTVNRTALEVITDSFLYTVDAIRDITIGLGALLLDAVRFEADFSQIAGPVGIVGLVGEASAYGVTALLMFTAFISLNLAVINVLPFPALDGGRLLFVIIEAVKGKPISPRLVGALNTVGFFLLIMLMVAVTWNDIARII